MKLRSREMFRRSAICLNCYGNRFDMKLDSNDDRLKPGSNQTAMIHEFGHVLGLADEYIGGSPHEQDEKSIMNYGAAGRDRHLAHLINWAKKQIDSMSNDNNFVSTRVNALKKIAEAKTRESEIDAVKAWRDASCPDLDYHISVRRRGTNDEMRFDTISFNDYKGLELLFVADKDPNIILFIWKPKSSKALKMFFVD